LRPSAQISRQYYRGERWYVVRDPAGNQYHRLSDPAYRFVALLDGSRTINQAWETVGGMLDDEAPTQPEVIQILSQLYAANLIEADVTPDSSVLLKRHRNLMKRKFQQRLMNTLFPRIPIWDPDRFLLRWAPVLNRIQSMWGVIIWLLVVGAALFTIAPMGKELSAAASKSINPNNWFYLWAVFVLTKFIHEMGHAASCRRFGGECHEMGVMFLVFIPTPYVDASAAWSFPNRWQRIYVGAAGMIVEIFCAALCAFVWASTVGGGDPTKVLINQLAYNAMLIASVSTVLFNANPLLRYDGYYMLSDFLEIPNLQKRSSDYTMGLAKRHLFKVKAREPLPNLSTRFWLFVYSIASNIYRVFVGLAIIVLVAFQVPILGILMSIGGMIQWLVMPLFKAFKYLALDAELHRKRLRAWAWSLSGLTAAVILIGVIKFPLWVRSDAVVETVNRQMVYSGAPGFVGQVNVRDGQWVKKGEVLVKMYDDQLASEAAETRSLLKAAEIRYRASLATDPRQARIDIAEVEALRTKLKDREERLAKLTITAEQDGQVVGPQLQDLPGRWISKGQALCMVMDPSELVVKSLVTQADAQLLTQSKENKTQVRVAGSIVEVIPAKRLEVVVAGSNSLPHPLFTPQGGGEQQVDPSERDGTKSVTKQFEVRIYLPEDVKLTHVMHDEEKDRPAAVLPGQRAYVRLDLGRQSVFWQIWRRVEQLIQSHQVA
jgi:putative peptide zinc metalloprotease protein